MSNCSSLSEALTSSSPCPTAPPCLKPYPLLPVRCSHVFLPMGSLSSVFHLSPVPLLAPNPNWGLSLLQITIVLTPYHYPCSLSSSSSIPVILLSRCPCSLSRPFLPYSSPDLFLPPRHSSSLLPHIHEYGALELSSVPCINILHQCKHTSPVVPFDNALTSPPSPGVCVCARARACVLESRATVARATTCTAGRKTRSARRPPWSPRGLRPASRPQTRRPQGRLPRHRTLWDLLVSTSQVSTRRGHGPPPITPRLAHVTLPLI